MPRLGQEAKQIGSARPLRSDDFVVSSYRENGVAYCRELITGTSSGGWRGNAHSGLDPFELNMATPQVIIGAVTLHATGYAMGIKNDGISFILYLEEVMGANASVTVETRFTGRPIH